MEDLAWVLVLLNLLRVEGKDASLILLIFPNEFNKFNNAGNKFNTGASVKDFLSYDTKIAFY